jgi:hypothetical protein
MILGGKHYRTLCIALLACQTVPKLAVAQDAEQGLYSEFTFSQQLVDNDSGTFARTRGDFTLSTTTAQRSLTLRVGGAYEFALNGSDDGDFVDPFVALNYSEETRNQRFVFDTSFRQTDIETSVLTATDLGFQVVLDDGQAEDIRARAEYEFGREKPFGGSLTIAYDERNYINTTSATLVDNSRTVIDGRLNFEINPKFRARVTGFVSELNREVGVDVNTIRFGLGGTFDVSSTLVADVDLSYSQVTESGPGADADRDGATFRFNLVETMQNGELSGTITNDITENGRITTISVGRSLELPRGSLRATLGYTFDENDNESPTFNISYGQEMPRGRFNVTAAQSFGTSADGNELLNSQISLRHSQSLTETTQFNVQASYSTSDFFSGLLDDTEQFDLILQYEQQITPLWSFTAGYSHTRRSSDNGTDATDNEVFVGLESTIGWRP